MECVCSVIWLSVNPWTAAYQAPLFMEYSRQEYLSGLSFPPPGDVPDSGIVPASLAATALAGEFFTTGPPGKPHNLVIVYQLSFSVLSWPLKPHLQRHRQLEEGSHVQGDTCKCSNVYSSNVLLLLENCLFVQRKTHCWHGKVKMLRFQNNTSFY